MLLASAGGDRVPVIAQLVQADEDTVRDVIHRFNEIGLACLDPQWAGGRPRLLKSDDEDFVIQTAITRPTKLGQPFTRWSIRKLAAYLRRVHGRCRRTPERGSGKIFVAGDHLGDTMGRSAQRAACGCALLNWQVCYRSWLMCWWSRSRSPMLS